jgi:hypothetical protein
MNVFSISLHCNINTTRNTKQINEELKKSSVLLVA